MPQRIHQMASKMRQFDPSAVEKPWYPVLGDFPPTQRLVRPALQCDRVRRSRKSKTFQPLQVTYPEDSLRSEFFGDHPWELARPRTVLEDDGKDAHRHDWSRIHQPGRIMDGERYLIHDHHCSRPATNTLSVIQRQQWLIRHERLTRPQAYDKARKEFYAIRHREEIERRIAKEEALMTGAYFAPGPLEVGMRLEDDAFEEWKRYAVERSATLRAMRSSDSGSVDQTEADGDGAENETDSEKASDAA